VAHTRSIDTTGTYDSFPYLSSQNKEELAEILSEIFPISIKLSREIVSNAGDWMQGKYTTPSWGNEYAKRDVLYTIKQDPYYHPLIMESPGQSSDDVLLLSPEDIVTSTYARSILYFHIASSRSLNYYPDSIRMPIVAYLNSWVNQHINKCAQNVLKQIDENVAEKIKHNHDMLGFSRFDIQIPLPFAFVTENLKKHHKKREDFLDMAIHLRDDKDVKRYRDWLSDFSFALRTNNEKEVDKMKKQLKSILEPIRFDLEDFFISSLSRVPGKLMSNPGDTMSIAEGPTEKAVSFAISAVLAKIRSRPLVFLGSLEKTIKSVTTIHDDINEIFGSQTNRIDNKDIKIFERLQRFQKGYLENVFYKKDFAGETYNVGTAKTAVLEFLARLPELKKENKLSEDEIERVIPALISLSSQ
jgi:hypothetical protein